MVWAPDSPDLWAPDSGGHLTLGRAVDRFLAAKAAEGAAAKTLEWYGMIVRRAVRGPGEDRPIEQLAGPELRAWILGLLLDCGLRVSEAAEPRLGDLRPDGTLKVMGKGAKERIVPVGGTARTAIVRYRGDSPRSTSK